MMPSTTSPSPAQAWSRSTRAGKARAKPCVFDCPPSLPISLPPPSSHQNKNVNTDTLGVSIGIVNLVVHTCVM